MYQRTGTGAFAKIDQATSLPYDNQRLFTGREYDKEAGLYYLRARYYDSSIGRFISRDPIGQADQVNLYGYVGNSPTMKIDPSGKSSKAIFPFFRQGQKEFTNIGHALSVPFVSADKNIALNSYYKDREFYSGNGSSGYYDLAYA